MPAAALLIALSSGIMLPYATQLLLPLAAIAAIFALVVACLLLQLASKLFGKSLSHQSLMLGCAVVTALLVGWSWSSLHAAQILKRHIAFASVGQQLVLDGTVVGLPAKSESAAAEFSSAKFYFLVDAVPSEHASLVPVNAKLRLNWRNFDKRLLPGSRWRLSLRLKPPVGMLNFHGFDYEAWLFSQSVNGTGYVRGPAQWLEGPQWRQLPQQWRAKLQQRINALFGNKIEQAALLRGLLIGDRSLISESQWQSLRSTGTAHLMAISGLHIGLMAGIGFLLTRLLWPLLGVLSERLAAQRAAVFVSGAIAVGYALLAGMQLPAQRALIMLSVALVALWFRRPVQPWLAMLVAFTLVLIWQPNAVLSGGFWLSFLAVFWIIYVLAWRRPKPKFLLGLLKVQLVLTMGLWPLSWYWFSEIAWLSPFVNLLAVPLMAVIVMPVLFVASSIWLLGDIFGVGSQLLLLLGALLDGSLTTITQLNAGLPSNQVQPLPLGLLLVSQIALMILLAPLAWSSRLLAIPLFCLIPAWSPPMLRERQLQVTFFDVGQGQSVLLQTRSSALLYDAGARFVSGFDMGARVVVPQLSALGVKQLDALVMSHGDNDHYGGLAAVMNQYSATPLLWVGGSELPSLPFVGERRHCSDQANWQWDGVDFQFLSPGPDTSEGVAVKNSSDNDLSCVLKVTVGDQSLMLTGDIAAKRERWLIQHKHAQLLSTVLQVPHHGSRSSSSADFLDAVKPSLAVVSAGFGNRFGHPAKAVEQRYRQRNIDFLSTHKDGAIRLLLAADAKSAKHQHMTARQTKKRFWRPKMAVSSIIER